MITGSNIVDVSTKKLYFKTITEIEIENLFKYLDVKKGSDIDVIPPKLIKLSANIRSRLVKEAIDHWYYFNTKCFFQKTLKLSQWFHTSRVKQTTKTHIFRPLSLLKVFPNVWERAIINKIVSVKEKHSSPLLPVYRKNCYLNASFWMHNAQTITSVVKLCLS